MQSRHKCTPKDTTIFWIHSKTKTLPLLDKLNAILERQSDPKPAVKKNILLIAFALVATCFGDETKKPEVLKNGEIEKIDARLAELTQIWREDTGIINRLTNFKKTPVQQGSQAYYTCLKSSQRIQQAEAEAKILKRKKAAIERGESPPDEAIANDSNSNSSDPFSSGGQSKSNSGFDDLEQKEAQYDKERKAEKNAANAKEDRDAAMAKMELDSKKIPDVIWEKSVHGPKVKGMFIGMSMPQFTKVAQDLGMKCYPGLNLISKFSKKDTGYGFTLSKPSGDVGLNNELIFADSDLEGKVTSLIFLGIIPEAFNLQDVKIEEFAKSFAEGYGVQLEMRMDDDLMMKMMGKEELTISYRGTSEEGVLVKIFTIGPRAFGQLRVILDKTASEKDIKKAFD